MKYLTLIDFEDSNNNECGFQIEDDGKLLLEVTKNIMRADQNLARQLAKIFSHYANTGKLPTCEEAES